MALCEHQSMRKEMRICLSLASVFSSSVVCYFVLMVVHKSCSCQNFTQVTFKQASLTLKWCFLCLCFSQVNGWDMTVVTHDQARKKLTRKNEDVVRLLVTRKSLEDAVKHSMGNHPRQQHSDTTYNHRLINAIQPRTLMY